MTPMLLSLAIATLSGAPPAQERADYIQLVRNPGSADQYVTHSLQPDPFIRVSRDEELLVILPDRRYFRISGPYSGSLSRAVQTEIADSSLQGRIAALFARARLSYDRIGGGRPGAEGLNPTPPVSNEGLPAINVDAEGPQCFTSGVGTPLWRSASRQADTYILSVPDGVSWTVTFAAGASTATWPQRMEQADELLIIKPDYGFRTRRIALRRLPSATTNLTELIEAGCLQQAQSLAVQLNADAESAP